MQASDASHLGDLRKTININAKLKLQIYLGQSASFFGIALTILNLNYVAGILAPTGVFGFVTAIIICTSKIISKVCKFICFYLLLITNSNYLTKLKIK